MTVLKRYIFLFVLLLTGVYCNGQNLKLTDTVFKTGDYYRTKLVCDRCPRPENRIYLDSVADFMKQNKTVVIEVGDHDDTRGNSIPYTSGRAEAFVEYLISEAGIEPERLVAKGYGGLVPLISEKEIAKLDIGEKREEAYLINHRTEFKILSTEFNGR